MSQTSTFVKKLASNDRKTRDSALEALKKYLGARSSQEMTLMELEKLWKGLYYSMWFSDRPKPQERLAEDLARLYSAVIHKSKFADFIEAFWVIMIREWPNIDQWRIDKFYLLIRRILRHNFKFLVQNGWELELVDSWVSVYTKLPLSGDQSVSVALPYHLCDIFIDELELVLFEEFEDDLQELDNDKPQDQPAKHLQQENAKLAQKKRDAVAKAPVKQLISPFQRLSTEAKLKTLREKAKNDVLLDQRLIDWNVLDQDDETASEDEWTGFN